LREFTELDNNSKKQKILEFFVDIKLAKDAIIKRLLIEEHQIEVIPQNINDAVLDDRINLEIIRNNLTADAFLAAKSAVYNKEKFHVFICHICEENLDKHRSICCDLCLTWNHVRCVKITTIPDGPYFCQICKR
jgi:hypothetical protein